MTAFNSTDLQIYNAKLFKDSVSGTGSSNLYFTYGRCFAWDDDTAPPDANTSYISVYDTWNNLIGGKRVSSNDIRHVIPRFDWETGQVYVAYDDTIDSELLKNNTTPFYVVTDDWNVYKCLGNNYGGYSTSKPTSISTTTDFQTSDGYIWKYMYSLTAEEQLRFVTTDYIPVKTLSTNDQSLQWQVQDNSISGGLHNILVIDGGTDYTANDISVIITGDGQDANAIAIRDVTTNTISSIVLDNKGINYSHANAIFYSPTGSGGSARVVISPPGGHGSDPLSELGGTNILINMLFKNYESYKLPVNNEFRQISLIESPKVFGTSNIISNTVVSQTTHITLNGISVEYISDEYVYQGASLDNYTFKGRVVEWDSANNILKLSNVTGDPRSELLIGVTSTAARFLSSVTDPDMEPYSGKLLYIDNIIPIQRAADQAEDFKIVLNF